MILETSSIIFILTLIIFYICGEYYYKKLVEAEKELYMYKTSTDIYKSLSARRGEKLVRIGSLINSFIEARDLLDSDISCLLVDIMIIADKTPKNIEIHTPKKPQSKSSIFLKNSYYREKMRTKYPTLSKKDIDKKLRRFYNKTIKNSDEDIPIEEEYRKNLEKYNREVEIYKKYYRENLESKQA